MKVRARNILGSVAIGALACSAMVATPAFAADDNTGVIAAGGSDNVERLQGVDRFATAIAASKAFDGVRQNTVIVANYNSWADIIAATPLAAELDANVLYSYAGNLEARTKAELVRLATSQGVSNVLFIGGNGVVTDALMAEVAALKDKQGVALELNVDRIGGIDRYETAQLLAAETVDYYGAGVGIAASRQAVAQNVKDQNAVATARAALAAAQTTVNSTTAALTKAIVNLQNAQTDRQIEASKLVTIATPEQEKALKDAVAAATTAYINSLNAYAAAVKGGDDAAIEAAKTNVDNAKTDLDAANKALADVVTSTTANDATIKRIEAIDKKIGTPSTEGTEGTGLVRELEKATDAQEEAGNKFLAAQEALAGAQTVESNAKAQAAALLKAYNDDVAAAIKAGKAYPAFVATGSNFADALAAGPAASQGYENAPGVVLLSNGTSVPTATQRYLDSGSDVVAVGGAAAAAVDADKEYVGKDRYATAAALAKDYQGNQLGLASGLVAADAVVAGALVANVSGAVVLTDPNVLSSATKSFVRYDYTGGQIIVFGGTGAVSTSVIKQIDDAING